MSSVHSATPSVANLPKASTMENSSSHVPDVYRKGTTFVYLDRDRELEKVVPVGLDLATELNIVFRHVPLRLDLADGIQSSQVSLWW